jgi:hypothetical protein
VCGAGPLLRAQVPRRPAQNQAFDLLPAYCSRRSNASLRHPVRGRCVSGNASLRHPVRGRCVSGNASLRHPVRGRCVFRERVASAPGSGEVRIRERVASAPGSGEVRIRWLRVFGHPGRLSNHRTPSGGVVMTNPRGDGRTPGPAKADPFALSGPQALKRRTHEDPPRPDAHRFAGTVAGRGRATILLTQPGRGPAERTARRPREGRRGSEGRGRP